MTAYKQPGVAHYTGNVRLWQTANVVRAPKIDFDQQKRAIFAQSDKRRPCPACSCSNRRTAS